MTNLPALTRDLTQLREDVDYLTALVEPAVTGVAATATTPANRPGKPAATAPHVWDTLTRAEAADAWTHLLRWVDWLIQRYQLDETLPGCWYRHGALVDELDALRAAWSGAYLDPAARPTDASYWHELFARTLGRIRDWDRYGCAAGTHRDDVAGGDLGDHDARAEFVHADLAARNRPVTPDPPPRSSSATHHTYGDVPGDGSGDTGPV